jgi:hypothetical protein
MTIALFLWKAVGANRDYNYFAINCNHFYCQDFQFELFHETETPLYIRALLYLCV